MKNINTLVLLLCIAMFSRASTSITSSSIAGHWTLSGSPYLIFNSVTIDSNNTLVIDPGVNVILQGDYQLKVKGILHADGSPSQYINFHRNDTTGWSDTAIALGGWGGMIVDNSYLGTDSVTFSYCNISDMKSSDIQTEDRRLGIRHCTFFHNKSGVMDIGATNRTIEISHCKFYDNEYYVMHFWLGKAIFLDNSVYNNIGVHIIYFAYASVDINQNLIYDNLPTDLNNEGALVLYYCKASITNNKIYGNVLGQIAALAAWGSEVHINGNYICNNKVLRGSTGAACGMAEGGGAIRLSNSGDTTYQLNVVCNNIIANNYAGYAGSAVYIYGSNVKIYNNDIANNSGGTVPDGAPIAVNDNSAIGGTYVSVKNNIFYNNVAFISGSSFSDTLNVQVSWADTFEFNHNYIERTIGSDAYFDYSAITHLGDTSNNIVDTAQQLMSPTRFCSDTESALLADFRLRSASACIDKGDSAGCVPANTDYWHNQRMSGTKIDIGAYEFQYPVNGVSKISRTERSIEVYPNPAKEIVRIVTQQNSGTITVVDMTGKEVNRIVVCRYITEFDVRNLKKGAYFIRWMSLSGDLAQNKFIVE